MGLDSYAMGFVCCFLYICPASKELGLSQLDHPANQSVSASAFGYPSRSVMMKCCTSHRSLDAHTDKGKRDVYSEYGSAERTLNVR